MATPFSNPSSTKKFLLAGFFLLLNIEVNSLEDVSFNFTKFTDDGSLILLGDAKISADGILAMPNDPSIGKTTSRAFYPKNVTIWDRKTGKRASFVTSFDFVVSDVAGYPPASGLVFFLAPWGGIPPNSGGGALGVYDRRSGSKFFGVEFDSFIDKWTYDPEYPHIGIDFNSVLTTGGNTVKWDRVSGALEKVTIMYDGRSMRFSVSVTHQNGEISTIATGFGTSLVLPSEVIVGFSATSWDTSRERHDIHSWSFSSTFDTNSITEENVIKNVSSA